MGISIRGITTSLITRINESAKVSFPKYPDLPVPKSCEQIAENDSKIFAYSVMLLLSPAIFLVNIFRKQSMQQPQNTEIKDKQ